MITRCVQRVSGHCGFLFHGRGAPIPQHFVVSTFGPPKRMKNIADEEDLFTPFRAKKLWVPHISQSEMWVGC